MPDTIGAATFEYADLLRAVGNYLDTQRFRDVTLALVEDGLFLTGQVLVVTERGSGLATQSYLFTTDDLDAALQAGYARRGTGSLRAVSRWRYEDVLRAIGAFLDEQDWRHASVFLLGEILHAKGCHEKNPVGRSFTTEELLQILATLLDQRSNPDPHNSDAV